MGISSTSIYMLISPMTIKVFVRFSAIYILIYICLQHLHAK